MDWSSDSAAGGGLSHSRLSEESIFTMPQFLTQRYGQLVATIMAVFWLLVYVFINLTSILYLGR